VLPLNNISHGVTTMQAARFYYLAETGRLISKQYFADFVEIISKPAIQHKFVKGIKKSKPDVVILRQVPGKDIMPIAVSSPTYRRGISTSSWPCWSIHTAMMV
jgi:hypothetical protein